VVGDQVDVIRTARLEPGRVPGQPLYPLELAGGGAGGGARGLAAVAERPVERVAQGVLVQEVVAHLGPDERQAGIRRCPHVAVQTAVSTPWRNARWSGSRRLYLSRTSWPTKGVVSANPISVAVRLWRCRPPALSGPVRLRRGVDPFVDGRVLVISAASHGRGGATTTYLTPK